MTIDTLELTNEIRTIDEKTPLRLGQNFDDIVSKINEVIAYVNANVTDTSDGKAEYLESDAITFGTEDPVWRAVREHDISVP